MNILVQNVKCAVGSKKHGRNDLKSIFKEKPAENALILTEFYRLNDYVEFEKQLINWGYEIYITSYNPGVNDILIAISKEYKSKSIEIPNIDIEGLPRILTISIDVEGKEIALVGVRLYGDYSDMNNQLKALSNIINEFECCILGGDFNNGRIRGEERALYSEEEIDLVYKGYDHFEYNYHRIKLELNKIGFSLETPTEGVSYKYPKPYTGGSKIDHFALKGVKLQNIEYIDTELSDHSKLVGKINISSLEDTKRKEINEIIQGNVSNNIKEIFVKDAETKGDRGVVRIVNFASMVAGQNNKNVNYKP